MKCILRVGPGRDLNKRITCFEFPQKRGGGEEGVREWVGVGPFLRFVL